MLVHREKCVECACAVNGWTQRCELLPSCSDAIEAVPGTKQEAPNQ